jgi:hypothetical protein
MTNRSDELSYLLTTERSEQIFQEKIFPTLIHQRADQ